MGFGRWAVGFDAEIVFSVDIFSRAQVFMLL